ncbi:hypothetical protein LJR231_001571 [Phyllobacterium sp. LjRoot231]|uniref:phage adaptor protein n=1 Tax=Phyllobacterium sp. LjRoot231 TaxID=3342289 RepID=UPI003ECD14AC
MTTGRKIMELANIILNDRDNVRWTLPEITRWINEAVRAIVLAKPSASSTSTAVQMKAGTLQYLPATTQEGATPLALTRLVRNLKDGSTSRQGTRIITATSRVLLDAQDPNWHDATRTLPKKEVRQYVYDEATPLEFYVYPGNDGTGWVEAVFSFLPTELVATGVVTDIASYDVDIGLPEPYSVPILDYVLFRCFSKDDLGQGPGRSAAHYQQFASAVGLKIQVEGATSPNTRKAA